MREGEWVEAESSPHLTAKLKDGVLTVLAIFLLVLVFNILKSAKPPKTE